VAEGKKRIKFERTVTGTGASILSAGVPMLHLLWILWILAGWTATRGRPWLSGLHIASLIWGVITELGPWPCPLTLAEQYLEARSGATAYQQGFLVHYLDKLIYPSLPEAFVGWAGASVCTLILSIYAIRMWKARSGPQSGSGRKSPDT
jgi:uncharacterized protein DUF2784